MHKIGDIDFINSHDGNGIRTDVANMLGDTISKKDGNSIVILLSKAFMNLREDLIAYSIVSRENCSFGTANSLIRAFSSHSPSNPFDPNQRHGDMRNGKHYENSDILLVPTSKGSKVRILIYRLKPIFVQDKMNQKIRQLDNFQCKDSSLNETFSIQFSNQKYRYGSDVWKTHVDDFILDYHDIDPMNSLFATLIFDSKSSIFSFRNEEENGYMFFINLNHGKSENYRIIMKWFLFINQKLEMLNQVYIPKLNCEEFNFLGMFKEIPSLEILEEINNFAQGNNIEISICSESNLKLLDQHSDFKVSTNLFSHIFTYLLCQEDFKLLDKLFLLKKNTLSNCIFIENISLDHTKAKWKNGKYEKKKNFNDNKQETSRKYLKFSLIIIENEKDWIKIYKAIMTLDCLNLVNMASWTFDSSDNGKESKILLEFYLAKDRFLEFTKKLNLPKFFAYRIFKVDLIEGGNKSFKNFENENSKIKNKWTDPIPMKLPKNQIYYLEKRLFKSRFELYLKRAAINDFILAKSDPVIIGEMGIKNENSTIPFNEKLDDFSTFWILATILNENEDLILFSHKILNSIYSGNMRQFGLVIRSIEGGGGEGIQDANSQGKKMSKLVAIIVKYKNDIYPERIFSTNYDSLFENGKAFFWRKLKCNPKNIKELENAASEILFKDYLNFSLIATPDSNKSKSSRLINLFHNFRI